LSRLAGPLDWRPMVTHRGGCHCGRVRFEVRAAAAITVSECNCSICSKSGYRAMIVPAERFTLLAGDDALTEYRFNTGRARHLFCARCGIKSFYVPRSHPDGISVNVRCLEPNTIESIAVEEVDGQNWEQHYPDGRAASYSN
jgi:hypothetical protein